MLRASIDLGTNTCLLLIAEWDPERKIVTEVKGDFATIVRLGKGVDQSRELSPVAMERTLTCLKHYAEQVRQAGVNPSDAVCVATSQARDARNGPEFFARVEKETGFRFKVISGDDEARFTFVGGLLPGMRADQTVVIDIGGGSTELMSRSGGQSLDIGSVRFTERFLLSDPVSDEEFWACQEAIDAEIQKLAAWRRALSDNVTLLGVAGTATTLAAWHLQLKKFEPAQVDQVTLTRGDVHRMVEELKWRTVGERTALPCVEPGRADVLLAGALILWRAMELLSFPECRVSTRGLRFGVF
jgi:exopolyphosphatase / guanosine-5'-triphosphate,3'-diphosphate pyrophosphatase